VKVKESRGAELLSIDELSDFLRVPVPTIYRWRSTGVGPRGIRVGRHLRFAVTDVLDWLEQKKS
jgi:excisionase family DNA binding protein